MIYKSDRSSRRAAFPAAFIFAVLLTLTFGVPGVSAQEIMRFAILGDYGSDDANEEDVANLIKSWNPDFIVTTGDNNYPDGEAATIDRNIGKYYAEFIYPYTGTYGPGSNYNRFFPALGNHDLDNRVGAMGQPYAEYFTLPGNERYYDFIQGPIHFFVINSDSREPDGVRSNSVQADWLRDRLAASTSLWKIVILHHPPYSSRTSWTKLQWPYKDWGADVLFAGHAHVYERIIRDGFPYITSGLGGDSTGSFSRAEQGSVARFGTDFGAVLATVSNTSVTFTFITRAGVVIDSYTLGPDANPPHDPTSLLASAISNGESTLTWNDNSINEDGYEIERSTNGGTYIQVGTTIANETSFVAQGLTVGSLYSFRIRGINNAGTSGYSNLAYPEGSVPTAPAAPSDLEATAASSSLVNLSWTDNSGNESGFDVERCEGSGCTDFVEIGEPTSGITTYQDGGLTAETIYRYRVRAFNGVGPSAYSEIASVTTPTEGGPTEPPSNLNAVATSSSSISISWSDDSDNEDGFKLERCEGSGCIDFAQIANLGPNTTAYGDMGLPAQTTFSYRVRAYSGVTDTAYSNTDEATTFSEQTDSLSDDFEDGVRDALKWDLGIVSRNDSQWDPGISVSESGGNLVITPLAGVSGSRYNGYVSVNLMDLTGGSAQVEVVEATDGSAATVFTFGFDKDNWYGFRKKGRSLYLERRISGSTSKTRIRYNNADHRYWRLSHDVLTDSILYETSPDGSVWTVRLSIGREIAINLVRVEMAAGTTSSVSGPGSARFNDLLVLMQ